MDTASYCEPLEFPDGRVYDVIDLCVEEDWRPRVRYRCSMEVHRRGIDAVTISFSIRMYHLAFRHGRLEEMSAAEAAAYTRRWGWNYLQQNRQRWPKSRWMRPVIVELK